MHRTISFTHYLYSIALIGLYLFIGCHSSQALASTHGAIHPAPQLVTTDTADTIGDNDDAFDMPDVYDPLEPLNRKIFTFNHYLDRWVIHPIASGYRYIMPKPGRTAIHNAFRNLGEPVTFLNNVLQADSPGAFSTLGRFMINSSFGIAGLYDVVPQHNGDEEDFGQTLGYYHVGTGPYLVLPIFGPSNIRDGIGLVADSFSAPTYYILNDYEKVGLAAAKGIDTRESVLDLTDEFDRTSLDPYATYRSLFTQHRQALVNSH